jgi:hypothetical protein
MKVKTWIVPLMLCLVLIGCDSNDQNTESKSVIAEGQLKALEKARGVEQVLKDSAEKRKKSIE